MDGDLEVAVVGGGHAGLLLAHGLAAFGATTCLIDPAPLVREPSPFDGRALALMLGSKQVFERLSAWSTVRPLATPIEGVRVLDVVNRTSVDYDASDIADHPFAYGILNQDLRGALARLVADERKIQVVAPDGLVNLRRRGRAIELELASGRTLRAALVVGADGRLSSVRTLAAIRTQRWSYRQTALTFAIRHERPHQGRVREFLRPGGPLALLPVGPRLTSVTWVERPDVADWLAALDGPGLIDRLDEETGKEIGPARLEGGVRRWPLDGHHAARPAAPRVVLVGDAAHGLHPIHAQGFNLGVRDVAVLVELIGAAREAGRDVGGSGLLLDYVRRRQADTRLISGLTDGLARLFSTDLAPARLVRGLGLTLVDRLPPLKAIAMRRGMGLGS